MLKNYFFLPFLLLLTACEFSDSEAVRSYDKHDLLMTALEEFETSRESSRNGLAIAHNRIDTLLDRYEREDPRAVTLEFDRTWSNVLLRIDALHHKFDVLNTRSERYFQMLREITANIADDELRRIEEEGNRQLQQHWQRELQMAKAKLDELDATLTMGNDLFKVMLLRSLRHSLSRDISELQSITMEAHSIMEELKKLSHNGIEMLKGA